MEVGHQGLEPGWETPDDLQDAYHHEDAVLVAQPAVAHALVQELDQGGAHVVVVAPVHYLHCKDIQSSVRETLKRLFRERSQRIPDYLITSGMLGR